MNATIKPTSQSKSESNQSGTNMSVWVLNKSTIPVILGYFDEIDNVVIGTYIAPNERIELSINANAILAVELEKLPPENQALYLGDEDSMEPIIQIADDTDYIGEPIKIGIASEVFNQVIKDDYDIVILQENKYNI